MIGYTFAQSILYSYTVLAPLYVWIILTFFEGLMGNNQVAFYGSQSYQADFIIDKKELTLRMNYVSIARSLGATFGRGEKGKYGIFRLLYDLVLLATSRPDHVDRHRQHDCVHCVRLRVLLGASSAASEDRACARGKSHRISGRPRTGQNHFGRCTGKYGRGRGHIWRAKKSVNLAGSGQSGEANGRRI